MSLWGAPVPESSLPSLHFVTRLGRRRSGRCLIKYSYAGIAIPVVFLDVVTAVGKIAYVPFELFPGHRESPGRLTSSVLNAAFPIPFGMRRQRAAIVLPAFSSLVADFCRLSLDTIQRRASRSLRVANEPDWSLRCTAGCVMLSVRFAQTCMSMRWIA